MSYQVLARKWRPARFQQLVGQEHVVQALVNALEGNRLHHAYLFSGTRGVGKTTIARIFAKSLNCEQGISAEPCGECASCVEIDAGRSVDLIEIDAASRTGVDDMRELLDNVQYAPTRGRFKIYLIDEVHMLSRHSFNALLKTLEEPPPHIKFLLATTDPQKIPVTVLSRCLQFSLKRMSRAQILTQLQYLIEQEQIGHEAGALAQLAAAADGSMRDALSLLDQAIGYGGGEVLASSVESMLGSLSHDYLLRLLDALRQQDAATLIGAARAVIEHNPDYQRVCAELIELLQQIAFYQVSPALAEDCEIDAEALAGYAAHWSAEEIQLYYQILLQGRQDLLIAPDAAAGFEMLMLRLFAFTPEHEVSAAADAVKKKPDDRSRPVTGASAAPLAEARGESPVEVQAEVAAEASSEGLSESPAVAPGEAAADASSGSSSETSAEAWSGTPADTPSDASTDTWAEPSIEVRADAHAETTIDAGGGAAPAIEDWPDLVYALGLGGLAQEIVANSFAAVRDGDHLRLVLPAEIFELLNSRNQDEIRQALERKLGLSLKLDWRASETLPGPTPLEVKKERERRRREAAIAAIRQDKVVLKLQRALAAELDEASVVRIETNGNDEVRS